MAARVVGGTTIIAVDLKPNRLQLASEIGATRTVNAVEDDPMEAIQQLTNGGAQYSFESTGVAPVIRRAVDALLLLGGVAWLDRSGRETKSP